MYEVEKLINYFKDTELNNEKNDILYGETCRRLLESGFDIEEDRKNNYKDVLSKKIDVAREEYRNAFYRMERIIDDVEFSENDLGRLKEHVGGFKVQVIPSFIENQIQSDIEYKRKLKKEKILKLRKKIYFQKCFQRFIRNVKTNNFHIYKIKENTKYRIKIYIYYTYIYNERLFCNVK
jgi:hypothetical protein